MKLIRNISRLFIGVMFVFSGFVKAIDPLGSTYKFSDYFTAFGMDWLIPAALFFAVLLSTIEFLIGFALLSNTLPRIFSIIAFAFMVFFTGLTLVLAITNPVSDCGCFGDAIKLTNWQTFYKNIFFLIPTVIVFWYRKKFEPRYEIVGQSVIVVLGALTILFISKYSYQHLPLIDFRAYNIGTNIKLAKTDSWIGAPQPVFDTKIIYEKDGEKQSFTTDNLPDTTWTWVETLNEQKSEGYLAPVQNFNITDENKQDVTNLILSDDYFSLMFVAYDLEKVPQETIEKIQLINDMGQSNGFNVFIVTASNLEQVKEFERANSFMATFYFADPITLKTIVRSNPGLLLLHSGQVLNKWHYNDFPDESQLDEYELYRSHQDSKLSAINWAMIGLIIFWILIVALFEIFALKSRFS
jgi:uncharacterized membrane protein YphA (DoxX/SURF4 family)